MGSEMCIRDSSTRASAANSGRRRTAARRRSPAPRPSASRRAPARRRPCTAAAPRARPGALRAPAAPAVAPGARRARTTPASPFRSGAGASWAAPCGRHCCCGTIRRATTWLCSSGSDAGWRRTRSAQRECSGGSTTPRFPPSHHTQKSDESAVRPRWRPARAQAVAEAHVGARGHLQADGRGDLEARRVCELGEDPDSIDEETLDGEDSESENTESDSNDNNENGSEEIEADEKREASEEDQTDVTLAALEQKEEVDDTDELIPDEQQSPPSQPSSRGLSEADPTYLSYCSICI